MSQCAPDDDSSAEAWNLVVRASPDASKRRLRVLAPIDAAKPEENFALVSALVRAPAAAATFLPALVRRRYEDAIWSLWMSLPHDIFWAAVRD